MSEREVVVWLTIVALGLVTVLTRGFFIFSNRPWPMPPWLERGLLYAPIAALAAVIAPEVLTTQGQFIDTWRDARPWATLTSALFFLKFRHHRHAVLGTMIAGMVVFLPLRVSLGW
ncbi:MAG: AzlD domain-containing protein [Alphaproteobacteria bacterium]|nr:AzlD domain-containing protein [Alphaproteobacteria bacterium]